VNARSPAEVRYPPPPRHAEPKNRATPGRDGARQRRAVAIRVGSRAGSRAHLDDDPFEVLILQQRLTTLAEEIRRIERDSSSLARAHHLRASTRAYDMALDRACALAGVVLTFGDPESTELTDEDSPGDDASPGESIRMYRELELCSRGWSW
jgi:hypothetical protein